MKKPAKLLVACTALLMLLTRPVLAQPYVPDDLPDGNTSVVTASWLGITILGNPSLRFSSVQDYSSEVTLDHSTLELNLGQALQWTLQVRATGDLLNGAEAIPISALSIQPLITGDNANIITLSTANQTLLSGRLAATKLVAPVFRYRAQGNKVIRKPAGAYSTTLIFTYTAL